MVNGAANCTISIGIAIVVHTCSLSWSMVDARVM